MPSISLHYLAIAAALAFSDVARAEPEAIDLARPAAESLSAISGLYWNFDVDLGVQPQVQDLSGNGYHGLPLAGNGTAPGLTTGVDRPGTSGYGKALELRPGEESDEGNPRVLVNLPAENRLAMAGSSFTGGLWLKLLPEGKPTERILLMDRGGFNTRGGEGTGHFCLYLAKAKNGPWQIGFQTGNGEANANAASQPLTGANLEDGQWHHIGFNLAADGENAVITFWLNGERVGEAPLDVAITAGSTSTTTRRFALGERVTSRYASRLHGVVDDLFLTEGIHPFKPLPTP